MAKILISDDSEFMRKVVREILEKNGYTDIIEASNGEEAIEAYDQHKPDLVLLDIIMPEKDGTEVLSDIVPKGAKVLNITAVGQESMIKKATALGSLGYIIKPFDEEMVISEVKKIIG
ncbi:two-component system response regulator [Candidatus Kaiserbacteria bacterium]|nr:MAG: two-component system response regulator [Candidatus Kaiserbacteria bacterium]